MSDTGRLMIGSMCESPLKKLLQRLLSFRVRGESGLEVILDSIDSFLVVAEGRLNVHPPSIIDHRGSIMGGQCLMEQDSLAEKDRLSGGL